ncbi:MAG: sensor histidine kinase [Rubrivivax sp.]|nr:sensor histidine kinase [Rubrivivax sp.]
MRGVRRSRWSAGNGQGTPRPWRALAWWLWLGLAAAFAAAAQAPTAFEDDSATALVFQRALAVAGEGSAFPEAEPATQVPLPDEWSDSRPDFKGSLWYRISLPAGLKAPEGDLLALYIARVCTNYEVFLNGQRIGSGGRLREPMTQQCHHPQLVTLPAALLREEGNLLDLRVVGRRLAEVGSAHRAGALSELVIGPQAQLAARHTRQSAIAAGFAQGASATLLLLGGFMFVLGYVNRRESQLAYFGVLSVGVALFDARLWLRDLPFGQPVLEFLLLSLLGVITWATVQFILRAQGRRLDWVDIGLPLQSATIAVSLMAGGTERLHLLALFWYGIFALEIGAALWLLWRLRARHGGGRLTLLVLACLGAAVGLDLLASGSPGDAWGTVGAGVALPVLLVTVGLRLVLRHGQARAEAEAHRAQLEETKVQLEQRVREATAEIERNLRQMAEHKAEQVAEKERKRIAADLHDDLGAKLLTIVHTSESDRISTLAREALEEMRLSVRGLTGRPVRLADAMGDWRAETVSRLAQAGIEGDWKSPEEAPQMLSSRAYVQTTRILREATSNIIKHSGASHCSVRCATTSDNDFQLVIQDNGDGISSQEVEARLDRGHGLASMKNRAKQLQGQCLVESGPGYGTVIRLTLPLDRATTGS